ncbi:HAD-IA family hydrolase [Streptomyces sp. NPDC102360]|uniref:HAD-IA family hydrolase n=1 Tax=Streptomyces sp. NPDC102360 TaxID=3366160 RepID=UPI0038271962
MTILPAPAEDPWAGISALLLDFDGVIIDTEYAHYLAWREVFGEHGLWLATDTWAQHWAAGRGPAADPKPPFTDVLAARLGRRLGHPAAVTGQVRERYVALRDALPLRPGIAAWIMDAARRGVRCAVVTDGEQAHVTAVLGKFGLTDAVTDIVGRKPGRAPKPAPDSYLAALADLAVDAGKAIAIEDSPHGIAAARAAGLRVLITPNKVTSTLLVPTPDTAIVNPQLVPMSRALVLLETSPSPRPPSVPPPAVPRIRSCLAGIGLGDALGKIIDKRARDALDPETHHLLDAFATGEAPPAAFTGRITDDTVLTLAFAHSIAKHGHAHRDALEAELRRLNPNGGRQIYKLRASGAPFHVATDGDTNGCVPRAAAIACLHTPDEPGELCYDTIKSATLTHAAPDAVMAALLFALAVSHAVVGEPPEAATHAIRTNLPSLVRIAGGGRSAAEAVLAHSNPPGPRSIAAHIDSLDDSLGFDVRARSSAIAGICLGLSGIPPHDFVPVLLRRPRGGDLDSVTAIACGLAYAFAPQNLPEAWTTRVEQYANTSLAQVALALDALRPGR